jgi:preprotein translocase SecF subunit
VALQEFGSPDLVLVRLQKQEGDEKAQITAIDKVKAALGSQVDFRRTEFVGPKVGAELIQDAVLASVLAMLGIMAYVWFRYEWQFAMNCIVAIFHDCITMVGLFSLLGLQFDLTIVAAVLTIAGFSVNDTVVIYDRVREELRRYKKMPIPELINLSINRTLTRTVMTSGLAFLSVLSILLFGGEVLRGFSIAMIWGIVIGTYSTICVATPMLIYMNIRRGPAEDKAGTPADGAPAGSADAG